MRRPRRLARADAAALISQWFRSWEFAVFALASLISLPGIFACVAACWTDPLLGEGTSEPGSVARPRRR